MADSFLSFHEVSDLCIGKPPLRCLPSAATVGEALSALKKSGEPFISVWTCNHHRHSSSSAIASESCCCVGKVSVVDVVCFLCREENLYRPLFALDSPVSILFPKDLEFVNVKHLDTDSSLLEAVDSILEGTQNLIIPVRNRKTFNLLQQQQPSLGSLHHGGQEYCWITQEDVVRFLFNSINVFTPLPVCSIKSLDLIDEHCLTLHYDDPVLLNLPAIHNALIKQMAVAVVDDEDRLIGEISSHTLSSYDETVAAAIATLSAGDLMEYIDCKGPPEDLVQLVKSRLEERSLDAMLELMEEDVSVIITPTSSIASDSSSSSDDELCMRTGKLGGSSGHTMNRTEAIACHPESSLAAVMIQALAHRINYVWVIDADYSVVGMVTFSGILKVLRVSSKS